MLRNTKIIFTITSLFLINVIARGQYATRGMDIMDVSTPTQWSFYKYIENPVSLFSGTNNITIELFTVKDGMINIPIELHYNTSGIKINEEASWVGLGWNLNVGGYRTEIIVDGSDESDGFFDKYQDKFYSDAYPQPATYAKYPVSQEDYNELKLYNIENLNFYGKTSPDVFFYAYPGGNGKYVINPFDGSAIQLRRTSDILIKDNRITTPEGICHEYDKDLEFISSDENGNVLYKSMPLKRSTYPNGDEISYTYREWMYADIQRSQSISGILNADATGGMIKENEERHIIRNGKHISKLESVLTYINTPCYIIEFHSSNREDHPIAKKLDSVILKNRVNGERIKKYLFHYSYFKPKAENNQTIKFEEYRLKLDSVMEQSVISSKCIGTYRFKYDGATFPSKTSYSCDYWGYANSDRSTTELDICIPNLNPLYWWSNDEDILKITKESTQWGNVDKRHNEKYCCAGMIKEVIYPTGGSTCFEYESNTFYDRFIPSVGDSIEYREIKTANLWDENKPSTDYPGQVFQFDTPRDFVISYRLIRGNCSWLELKDSRIALQTGIMTDNPTREILYNFNADCERAFYNSEMPKELTGDFKVRIPAGTNAVSISLPDITGNDKGVQLVATIKYIDCDATEDIKVMRTSHGAGMRIKSICHKDKDGSILQTKHYEYNDGSESSGRLYTRPQYDRKTRSYSVLGFITTDPLGETEVIPGLTVSLEEYEINSNRIESNPYGMPEGVGYGCVRESIEGIGGYKEYRFNTVDLSPMENDYAQFSYLIDNPLIGKCKSERIYDSLGTLIENHEYSYRHNISKNYVGIRLVSAYDWHNDAIAVTSPESYRIMETADKPYQNGCLWMYKYILNQNEVFLESELSESDGVIQSINYEYDSLTMLPTVINYSQSDGSILSHHYSYLNNRSKHIISPITSESLEYNGCQHYLKSNRYDDNGLLREICFTDIDDRKTISAWRKEKSDSRGNALEVQIWECEKEKYRWNEGGRLLTEKSVSTDSTGNNWLTTSYSYDSKGQLSKITQPNGIADHFVYDGFGRLRAKYQIIDGVLKMDESYDYKLYTDNGSSGDNYISRYEHLNYNDSREIRTYLNGLGLAYQEIETDGTVDGQTRIYIHEFDTYLREHKHFLPYGTDDNTAIRRVNASSEQKKYYNCEFAYTEDEYENNLRGRITGTIKAGDDTRAARVKSRIEYRGNNANEVLWIKAINNGSFKVMGYYADSTLCCTRLTDESGKETLTYKDLMGRIVLERRILNNPNSERVNIDTYYVYDDFTNLRYIVPADVSALLETGASYKTDSDMANRSYYYEYDGFGREIKSRIPLCGETIKKYDKRGLVIEYEGPRERDAHVFREFEYDGLRRPLEERVVGESQTLLMHKLFYDTPMEDAVAYRELDGQTPVQSELLQNTNGMPTGEWVALYRDTYYDRAPHYLKRSFYYNKLGRLVQKAESDIFRGDGYFSYTYDYRGNITEETEEHFSADADGNMTKTTGRHYGRNGLIQAEHSSVTGLNTGMGRDFEYDCRGNLLKTTFTYYGENPKCYEQINTYNIRNELIGSHSPYYSQDLEYGYDGLIIKSVFNRGEYSYNYLYDSAGRLKSVSTSSLDIPTESNMRHDLMGRLQYMERSTASSTDTLRYLYTDGRLHKVNNSTPYRYNSSGDMTFDGRTGYSTVYGLPGLPSNIDTGNNDEGLVYYEYLWTGEKTGVEVSHHERKTLYLDSFVLNNDKDNFYHYSTESVAMPGGRLSKTDDNNEMIPMFYFTDYLGSVRAIVDARSGKMIKKYDYYPYGLEWGQVDKRNEHRYKYNSKESQANLGISYLDYGARFYDPYTGSWTCADPLAHKYPDTGNYVFCASNPVNYIDPNGKVAHPIGDAEIEAVRRTLPNEARKYVKFDKNGNIDVDMLLQYGGSDHNYRCLMILAKADYITDIAFSDEYTYRNKNGIIETQLLSHQAYGESGLERDTKFQNTSGLTTGEGGKYGTTLFPDNDGLENSPDDKIHEYIVDKMTELGRSEGLSHELYGHALLYILTNGNHNESSHKFDGCTDTNKVLRNYIFKARKTTVNNYNR